MHSHIESKYLFRFNSIIVLKDCIILGNNTYGRYMKKVLINFHKQLIMNGINGLLNYHTQQTSTLYGIAQTINHSNID